MADEKYSPIAILAAFITTLLYMGLFIFFKQSGMSVSIIVLNTAYAFYAALIVILDRTNKFNSKIDLQLVTLGTVLAPIAVTTIDAMYAMTEGANHLDIKIASLIVFGAFCAWVIFTVLAYITITYLHRKLAA